ncbi:MAG: hypothetical protein IKR84_02170 [Oscillibacter sp.]|nr:hypothetical protein [Oscillibacter sp.]
MLSNFLHEPKLLWGIPSFTHRFILRLCRRIRNQLAHNKPVDCDDVEAVMSL